MRRVSWIDLAIVVRRAIGKGSGLSTDQRVRWLKEAATASGYSVGALRRFLNTLEFLESVPEQSRPDDGTIRESFTGIEMIQRIASHDAEEAARLLLEFRAKKIPVSKLRSSLKDSKAKGLSKGVGEQRPAVSFSEGGRLPPGSSAAASERNWRANAALRLVHQLLPKLTGKYDSFQQPLGSAPIGVRCDAIAWVDGKWTKGDGFEIVHAPAAVAKSIVSDRVSRAIVAARVFRRFYLVFTPDSWLEHVHRAAGALDQLEARAIGVVWLQAEKPLIRKRTGPSVPDWSDRLSTVCPGGKWDEHYSQRRSGR
jgi:hypothetical protein